MKVIKENKGFTLLEVLVAMGIMALLISTATGALTSQTRQNYEAKLRSEAVYAAQSVIDELRLSDVSEMPTGGSDSARTITIDDARGYAVTANYCTDSSLCFSNDVRQVQLDVVYRGKTLYTTETVFTDFDSTGTNSGSSSSSSSGGSSSEEGGSSSTTESSGGSGGEVTTSSTTESGKKRKRRCRRYRC